LAELFSGQGGVVSVQSRIQRPSLRDRPYEFD
jgi:hypothetical protein